MKRIKAGDVVRVTRDINAIPEGTYRVLDADEWFCSFQVGKSIAFSISWHANECFVVLPKKTQSLTSQKSFLNSYYKLLEKCKREDNGVFDPTSPFTHCMISTDVAREVQ